MLRKSFLGAVAGLVLGAATLGFGHQAASAEVTNNVRSPFSYPIVNPCNGLTVNLQGEVHMVWYTTPEGHTIMRYNAQYRGTDSAGNEYVVNVRRVMDHPNWPSMYPFSDLIVYNATSKGGAGNFSLTRSIDVATAATTPYTVEFSCRG